VLNFKSVGTRIRSSPAWGKRESRLLPLVVVSPCEELHFKQLGLPDALSRFPFTRDMCVPRRVREILPHLGRVPRVRLAKPTVLRAKDRMATALGAMVKTNAARCFAGHFTGI